MAARAAARAAAGVPAGAGLARRTSTSAAATPQGWAGGLQAGSRRAEGSPPAPPAAARSFVGRDGHCSHGRSDSRRCSCCTCTAFMRAKRSLLPSVLISCGGRGGGCWGWAAGACDEAKQLFCCVETRSKMLISCGSWTATQRPFCEQVSGHNTHARCKFQALLKFMCSQPDDVQLCSGGYGPESCRSGGGGTAACLPAGATVV